MAVKEGLRRVNKLARVIGTTGALLMLLAFVASLVSSKTGNGNVMPIAGVFLGPGVWLLGLGIVLLVIGWVCEGFAKTDGAD